MKKKKQLKNTFKHSLSGIKAYSLVEVLVAVSIFAIAVSVPTSLFISALRNQTRALDMREIVDNTSYATEYISRALRMARKELNPPTCLSSYGLNYEETNSRTLISVLYNGPGIRFINHRGECQEFFLDTDDSQLKETKDWQFPIPLTAKNLEVSEFKFELSGEGQGDDIQPRVTMLLEIKKIQSELPKTIVQTTISQRNLDISY